MRLWPALLLVPRTPWGYALEILLPFNSSAYTVMIASPGDVARERKVVRKVLQDWNDLHSIERKIVLLPRTWETHSHPVMGERAQGLINKQVLKNCDLLIGVFWTRIGTPTGVSPSGTVEEIREHMALGKPAMLYFSDAPVDLSKVDRDQYEKLRAFRRECMGHGLIENYKSCRQFEVKLARQLHLTIINNDHLFRDAIWRV
jgi:hypothetical protein